MAAVELRTRSSRRPCVWRAARAGLFDGLRHQKRNDCAQSVFRRFFWNEMPAWHWRETGIRTPPAPYVFHVEMLAHHTLFAPHHKRRTGDLSSIFAILSIVSEVNVKPRSETLAHGGDGFWRRVRRHVGREIGRASCRERV